MVAETDVSICVVLMIPCQTEANSSYFCPKLTDSFSQLSEGGLFSSVSLKSKMRETYLARKQLERLFRLLLKLEITNCCRLQ